MSLSNKLTEGIFSQDVGTSHVALYVSHIAALILERYTEVSNNLLRAILVSSSDVPREIELQVEKLEDTETFIDMLQPSFRLNAKGQIKSNKKKMLHYLVGYGYPNQEVATDSFEQRVMLLADESLQWGVG